MSKKVYRLAHGPKLFLFKSKEGYFIGREFTENVYVRCEHVYKDLKEIKEHLESIENPLSPICMKCPDNSRLIDHKINLTNEQKKYLKEITFYHEKMDDITYVDVERLTKKIEGQFESIKNEFNDGLNLQEEMKSESYFRQDSKNEHIPLIWLIKLFLEMIIKQIEDIKDAQVENYVDTENGTFYTDQFIFDLLCYIAKPISEYYFKKTNIRDNDELKGYLIRILLKIGHDEIKKDDEDSDQIETKEEEEEKSDIEEENSSNSNNQDEQKEKSHTQPISSDEEDDLSLIPNGQKPLTQPVSSPDDEEQISPSI